MKPWIAEQRNWHAFYWKKSPKVKASTIRSFHLIKKQVATCYLAIIFFLRCTWIPSRLQKCTDFQYSWLSLFPAAAFQLWNKKWKLNNIGQSKSLIQHPETICWLMTWMTVNFQDGCQLFRMIVNFSGWFQTFQDGWGGYNAFAVYCLRSSGWSYLRTNKEHSIVFSWVLLHFFQLVGYISKQTRSIL